MSRIEGLTFDAKSERELDKIIDDVALRIDTERPSEKPSVLSRKKQSAKHSPGLS
ncbi:hypothetical protein GNI_065150 [Gregarina niphandrodes]|uniref:Uncharacterized protein n=1 Tax=Gregarina niphandrodes TaxID=110365 RepID=A0A023B7W6_GRENI|nr:hypothetical protein GNI_065150 [Gregarina niphandrodes]EZG67968.1 hypothetical protein GNI_065150 [Gregarina niphandrodes]|eukprot:XP_011130117.1 hypothetical protein GNI_065150 [Gregarina niphandrodes]